MIKKPSKTSNLIDDFILTSHLHFLMVEYIPYNSGVHKDEVESLYSVHILEVANHFTQSYQLDVLASLDQPLHKHVEEQVKPFTNLSASDGVFYIIEVEGKAAGMGLIRKIGDNLGEIRLMYNRPEYRGFGYGKGMVKRLLEYGVKLGLSTVYLSTYKWMAVAQHIYRSAGFKERDAYPEAEPYRKNWKNLKFMEKKL
jgi:GNAT superfamily N-acetyltransferase